MAKKDLAEQLTESFERWDKLYCEGGSDPLYTDGENLNLVRNHIIYRKREIEEQFEPVDYPEIYHRGTPPEVSKDYMAQSDRIRADAARALEMYQSSEDYKFLLARVDLLHPREADNLCIKSIIGYTKGLEEAVKDDDLIRMRRHRNPEVYLRAFRECAREIREIKPREGQMDIFDVLVEVTA